MKDLECFNCHKKGHRKSDFWAKGGGKEGQGPRLKDRKGRAGDLKNGGKETEKSLASVAESEVCEDGVWMASINDSVTIILLSFYYSLIRRHAALSAAFSFHLDLLLFTLPQRSLMASFL